MANGSPSPEVEALQREIQRAKLEEELAKARKEAAEANRAAFEAQLPKTQTKGAEGSVTLQAGAGYYSEILAYRTLRSTAKEIADGVAPKPVELEGAGAARTIILTDHFDLAANDALWQLIDLKLKDFDARLDDALQRHVPSEDSGPMFKAEVVPAALLAVPAILGAAADIAAFFRVNREIAARAVTLSGQALLAEMASALVENKVSVVIPSLRIGERGNLFHRLSELQAKRRRLAERRLAIHDQIKPNPVLLEQIGSDLAAARQALAQIQPVNAQDPRIATLENEIRDLVQRRAEETQKVAAWTRVTSDIDPLLQELVALETTLTSRPTGEVQSPLEAVATIDVIRALGDAKVLYVSVVSQGGEVEVTKGAWSTHVSYIGGSVVSFFLMSAGVQGVLEQSGIVPSHLTSSFKGGSIATL